MTAIVAKPIGTFREMVDAIPSLDAKIVVQFLYETAARVNEAASKGPAEYLLRTLTDRKTGQKYQEMRQATMPTGPKRSDVTFDSYEGQEVMLITMTILKRKLKASDGQPIRLARIVGLPIRKDPWVKELADYIEALKPEEGIIPYRRRDISDMLLNAGMTPKNLLNAPPNYRMENPLRHVRISHLQSNYGFHDEEMRRFIGWSLSGPGGSSTQRAYEHTDWQFYIPKLLKDLPTFARQKLPADITPLSPQKVS